jgi:hypothetical protein
LPLETVSKPHCTESLRHYDAEFTIFFLTFSLANVQKTLKTNGAYFVIVTVNPDINVVDMCTSLLGHMQASQGKERDLVGVTQVLVSPQRTP